MKFLALLLTCLPCFAQFPYSGVTWQAPSSSVPGPQSIAGLAYYWVSSDMPIGGTVSNWVDRVQGAVWTNGVSARWPTNTAQGVFFNGTTNQLTNAAFGTIDVTKSFYVFMIIKPLRDTLDQDGLWSTVIGGSSLGLDFFSSGNVCDGNGVALFKCITNNFQDWLFSATSANSFAFYTNNVVAKATYNTLASSSVMTTIGGFTAPFTKPWQGVLCEWAVYTNSTCTNASNRAILHTYATTASAAAPYSP